MSALPYRLVIMNGLGEPETYARFSTEEEAWDAAEAHGFDGYFRPCVWKDTDDGKAIQCTDPGSTFPQTIDVANLIELLKLEDPLEHVQVLTYRVEINTPGPYESLEHAGIDHAGFYLTREAAQRHVDVLRLLGCECELRESAW
jgi:hypothetical protein